MGPTHADGHHGPMSWPIRAASFGGNPNDRHRRAGDRPGRRWVEWSGPGCADCYFDGSATLGRFGQLIDGAPNLTTGAFTAADVTASAKGWEGNGRGVVICLGGTFEVTERNLSNYGFGIYDGAPHELVGCRWLPARSGHHLPTSLTRGTVLRI